MTWSRDRGDSERRSYYHGNLREALIRAALELIAAKGLGRDEDAARELRSSTGRVRRSRRAHGDNPLYLHRMPPVALGCGNPLIVESTGDVGCGSDALSAQSLNGCHGGFVTHQPYRLVWPVVVHGALPAGLRRRCIQENAPVAILIPVHDFIPAHGCRPNPASRIPKICFWRWRSLKRGAGDDLGSPGFTRARSSLRRRRPPSSRLTGVPSFSTESPRAERARAGHEPATGSSSTFQLPSAPRQASPPARLDTPSRLSLRVNSRHSAPKRVVNRPASSMRPRSPALPA